MRAQSAVLRQRIQEACVTDSLAEFHVRLGGERYGRPSFWINPGSLQLLAYYGFALEDDRYRNTVSWIHSEHNPDYCAGRFSAPACEHAPYPWVLSLCYQLLTGDSEKALQQLLAAELDNDIACETIDPQTGRVKTGAAFATCAGFLSHSLFTALHPTCKGPENEGGSAQL